MIGNSDLVCDGLRAALPAPLRGAVREAVLERTPHGGQRWRLCDGRGETLALAWTVSAAPLLDAHALPPALVPRHIADCEIAGRRYLVREYVRGTPLDLELRRDPTRSASLLRELGLLLQSLQGASAYDRICDDAAWSMWVGGPLRELQAAPRIDAAQRAALANLADSLREMRGAVLRCAVHHGDFQFSNLIRRPDGSLAIIDWELSRGTAPVLMDWFHLWISLGVERSQSYESAALALTEQLAQGDSTASLALAEQMKSLGVDAAEPRWHAALCVLHGLAHFARRVPHLADADCIAGFLRAARRFLQSRPG